MKKIKNIKTSKISDFFSKTPSSPRNGINNKRKLSDTSQPTSSAVLTSVINVPKKCSPKVSPTCKKIKHDENCIPPAIETVAQKTESMCCSTNSSNNFKVETPKKGLTPSSSMKTPTSKKAGSGSARGTPRSGRKGTPKKLFEKSPRRLEEFNVQVLEAFVQVSPSVSNKKVRKQETPSKNTEKVEMVSRCSPAQSCNETTPSKSLKIGCVKSPKLRKLSFLEVADIIHKQENMDNEEEKKNNLKNEIDFLEDEFDELLDFEEAFYSLNLQEPQHCTIMEVNCNNERITLKLKSNKNSCSKGICNIEEFWTSGNHFKAGDTVYIKAEKVNNQWLINNTKGWLVYEPDLLIPCTSVVGSLFCKRKSVLADRFRDFEPGNRIMLIGVLAHSLLQQTLKNKLKTYQQIKSVLKSIIMSRETIKRLYETNMTIDEIETELETFIPKLVSFVSEYITGDSLPESSNWQSRIDAIDDIEDNLWCPELGIKGRIDVTVGTKNGVMPLELKTGRATMSLEHRGQVVLYVMMMNKLGYDVSSGLLMYLREGILKEIKPTPQEQRDVLILRNEFAYFLSRIGSNDVKTPPELPEPLNNHRICTKCPYSVLCTSYLNYENHDLSTNQSIRDIQKTVSGHLTKEHLDYFFLWSNFLGMENESQRNFKSIRKIYTVPPEQRESDGKCISNVQVTWIGDDQNGLYEHVFEKIDSNKNLTNYEMQENSYVVVSTDKRPAVATGFVQEFLPSSIKILLDKNLNKKYKNKVFHLDTYDSNITYGFNMTSLALLLQNNPRAEQLRSIIIDKKTPTFLPKLPSVVAKKGGSILKRLNLVQQRAVLKALCANEYLLIKGMPGTGKSATIVALIQLLIQLEKSILITSHTHSAIDNICIRLQKRGVDFLRLGSKNKIDPYLVPNSEATVMESCKTPQEIAEVYNKYQVVAVTCLGSGHPLLSKRMFDVCIVDESTQVLQTSVIKPLHSAKSFVLIGDPLQLAPVVKNRTASNAGMSETLFERLESSEGTVALNLNYRMNVTITNLANVLTYGGELKVANEGVGKRVLEIPHIEVVNNHYSKHPWLLEALDTSLENAVQIIDTGPVWKLPQDVKWHLKNTKFESESLSCVNLHEVLIVVTLVKALIMGGVSNDDIGVIATYRSQMCQISASLDDLNVNVSTVDQFQGRDKNVIIYSCTKSADPSAISENVKHELLEDKRRLTVAITRAKRKLLIVGDVSTLQRFSTFSSIMPALKNHIVKFNSSWNLFNNL